MLGGRGPGMRPMTLEAGNPRSALAIAFVGAFAGTFAGPRPQASILCAFACDAAERSSIKTVWWSVELSAARPAVL